MTLGERIARKRKELGLSQEALGERLGVSRQAIYKWESDASLPEIEKLIALSGIFSVPVGWLLGVEELPPEGEAAPAGELTQEQLAMVREIVDGYLAAGYACASAPLSEIVEGFDACVRMKFPLPSGESAVALLRLAGDNLLEAVPVLYSVSPTGGAQGPYRLEHLRREETAPLP